LTEKCVNALSTGYASMPLPRILSLIDQMGV